MNLNITGLPAFDDNYIWLLQKTGSAYCVAIDPGDEQPVIAALQEKGLELAAILITHKHYDHVGGVAKLCAEYPAVRVFGPGNEGISGITDVVEDQQVILLPGLEERFDVLAVPGHTEGHVAYYAQGMLFCGDTLFAGGCGRVFSGTFEQMAASLQRIAALPPDTRIYCAHEYTEVNLGFARWVEPQSAALLARQQAVTAARSHGLPTVPSLLSDELETNPFLRVDQPQVVAAASRWSDAKLNDAASVFTALRQWKDRDYD